MAAGCSAKGMPGRSRVGLVCHLGVKSEDVAKLEVYGMKKSLCISRKVVSREIKSMQYQKHHSLSMVSSLQDLLYPELTGGIIATSSLHSIILVLSFAVSTSSSSPSTY